MKQNTTFYFLLLLSVVIFFYDHYSEGIMLYCTAIINDSIIDLKKSIKGMEPNK